MDQRSWSIDALATIAAVIAAYCALVAARAVTFSASIGDGSGGIGAVSLGCAEVGILPLGIIASAIANRALAGWAHASGAGIKRLHRSHSAAFLAWLGLWLVAGLGGISSLFVFSTMYSSGAFQILMTLIGMMSTAQFILIAVLLVLFIWRRRVSRAKAH